MKRTDCNNINGLFRVAALCCIKEIADGHPDVGICIASVGERLKEAGFFLPNP